MTTITTDDIKSLRERTGLSVMDCKHALEQAEGDMEKALLILRKKSSAAAAKKSARTLGAGVVQAYIHASQDVGAMVLLSCETDFVAKKSARTLGAGVVQAYIHASQDVGAMVLLSCETDFVAKNEEFKTLAHNIAMHATATNPEFVSRTQVTEEATAKAKQLFEEEAKDKPEDKRAAIVEGKLNAYLQDRVLLEQSYIKNPELTIQGLVEQAVQKFGERIEVSECVRFSVKG